MAFTTLCASEALRKYKNLDSVSNKPRNLRSPTEVIGTKESIYDLIIIFKVLSFVFKSTVGKVSPLGIITF